jgi:pyruvate, orthophosphate dikinase
MRAVDAVFRSWLNPRAFVYRKANKIPDDYGPESTNPLQSDAK